MRERTQTISRYFPLVGTDVCRMLVAVFVALWAWGAGLPALAAAAAGTASSPAATAHPAIQRCILLCPAPGAIRGGL